jgi:hypothetical protein
MMQVMASTYTNLGLYPRAHELAKRALDARLSLLGPDDPKTLESMTQLGLDSESRRTFCRSGEDGAPGAGGRAPHSRARGSATLETMVTWPAIVQGRVITTRGETGARGR